MTYADGQRVQLVRELREFRAGSDETRWPTGSRGTVVRGDLFGGRRVQVRLDGEEYLTRLVDAAIIEPVDSTGEGSNP